MTPQISPSHRFSTLAPRDVSERIHPISAVMLAFGLALAIVTEGQIPMLWTKAMLGMLIAPTVVTALWLTGPRDAEHRSDDRDPRRA